MDTIYTSGKYLEANPNWHTEDSPWKAAQISKIISDNHIHPSKIGEIGCGAGAMLEELSKKNSLYKAQFKGYDISPQAIELAKARESKRVQFLCEDLLSERNTDHFDVL